MKIERIVNSTALYSPLFESNFVRMVIFSESFSHLRVVSCLRFLGELHWLSYRIRTTCNRRLEVKSLENALHSGSNCGRSSDPKQMWSGDDIQFSKFTFFLFKITLNGHWWIKLLDFLRSSRNRSTIIELPKLKYWHTFVVTFVMPINGLNLVSVAVL